LPARNRGALLAHTLESARAQRNVDVDILIVDDGSADDTVATIDRLADPRITVLRQPHAIGVSGARNRGVEAAAGDWIAFLDDDDLWSPDKLASQLAVARATERRWVCSGSVTVADNL